MENELCMHITFPPELAAKARLLDSRRPQLCFSRTEEVDIQPWWDIALYYTFTTLPEGMLSN